MQQTLEREDSRLRADRPRHSAARWAKVLWVVVAVGLGASRLLGPVLAPDPFERVPWVLGVWLLGPWLLVGIVWWATSRLPWDKFLTPVQRFVVTAFAVAMFVVQHSPMELDAYPFTSWSMYTVPVEAAEYTEFRTMASGDPVGHLPIADLVPNTLGRAFMFGLGDWAEAAEAGDPEAADVVARTLRHLMGGLGDPAVDAVEVRRCRVKTPTPEAPVQCSTMVTVAR